jgi:hypothetical protein
MGDRQITFDVVSVSARNTDPPPQPFRRPCALIGLWAGATNIVMAAVPGIKAVVLHWAFHSLSQRASWQLLCSNKRRRMTATPLYPYVPRTPSLKGLSPAPVRNILIRARPPALQKPLLPYLRLKPFKLPSRCTCNSLVARSHRSHRPPTFQTRIAPGSRLR